jgi:hypothetical protein
MEYVKKIGERFAIAIAPKGSLQFARIFASSVTLG